MGLHYAPPELAQALLLSVDTADEYRPELYRDEASINN